MSDDGPFAGSGDGGQDGDPHHPDDNHDHERRSADTEDDQHHWQQDGDDDLEIGTGDDPAPLVSGTDESTDTAHHPSWTGGHGIDLADESTARLESAAPDPDDSAQLHGEMDEDAVDFELEHGSLDASESGREPHGIDLHDPTHELLEALRGSGETGNSTDAVDTPDGADWLVGGWNDVGVGSEPASTAWAIEVIDPIDGVIDPDLLG